MTELRHLEYAALRATLRERGTTRIWLFVLTLAMWAALTVAAIALIPLPVIALLPLVVLAAGFEGVYSLHVGVERIGRYVQVFYEERGVADGSLLPGQEDRGGATLRSEPASGEGVPRVVTGRGQPPTLAGSQTPVEEPQWETVAMAFGRRFPGSGPDPLFLVMFGVAAVVNLDPALLPRPTAEEIAGLAAAHLLFLARLVVTRRRAAGQRAADLDRLRQLAAALAAPSGS